MVLHNSAILQKSGSVINGFEVAGKQFCEQYNAGGAFIGYYNGSDRYENPTLKLSSGGITGTTLNATFSVTNLPASELQIVQTINSTANITDGALTGVYRFTEGGVNYGGSVDGGVNSLFGKRYGPAHSTKPFYNTVDEQLSQLVWGGANGSIKVYDRPNVQNIRDVVRFQTMVVATNYLGSGQDLMLGSFEWGWKGQGSTAIHGSTINLSNSISTNSMNIMQFDYPSYNLLK